MGFGTDWDDIYSTELFKTISGQKSFDFKDYPPLFSSECPGLQPLKPIILKVGDSGM